nr:MAG TPA: hypothetical protein [Caudoviricetes sp.]
MQKGRWTCQNRPNCKTIIYHKARERKRQRMPKTKKEFDQLKYQNQFINEKYDRINLTVPKGDKAVIKERAAAAGESVNEYINQAIKQRMENTSDA